MNAISPEFVNFRLIAIAHDCVTISRVIQFASEFPWLGFGLMLRDPERRQTTVSKLVDYTKSQRLPDNVAVITNSFFFNSVRWGHLTAAQLQSIPISEYRGRAFGCSVHSTEEVERATSIGARFFLLSPIFETPSKLGVVPLGVDYVTKVSKMSDTPIFALGGVVSLQQVDLVLNAGAYGIAGIRLFQELPDDMIYPIIEKLSEVS